MLLQIATLVAAMFQTFVVPGLPGLPVAQISRAKIVSEIPSVEAASVFLIDTKSGTLIAVKQADVPRPIASITKLMTALVVLDRNPDWNRFLTFESRDQRKGDTARIFLGEEFRADDIWNLMLVASSNDAAALLARAMFGSEAEFVVAMNKKARDLGLYRTHFEDATGLSVENVSTAREVAIMARLALSLPKIRNMVAQRQITFAPRGKASRVAYATNQLLSWFNLPGVQLFGGKTGHIDESGYNFVLAAGGIGHELIGVVLGSRTNNGRFEEMATLLKWGFNTIPRSQSPED